MASRGSTHEVEGREEEFQLHLTRGTELVGAGDLDGARAALERARALRPKDVKVLGLLGQAYYRLGRFEEAGDVWQRLVDESPVEPAARVNLGLARLKAKRHADAAKQLEIALDLNPEHPKAMGYLGLALLEGGDPAAARVWFVRAGSEQLVARCDELLAAAGVPATDVEEPSSGQESGAPDGDAAGEPGAQADTWASPAEPPSAAVESTAHRAARGEPGDGPAPGEPVEPRAAPGGPPAPGASASQELPSLSAWAASRVMAPHPAATFHVGDGVLAVAVRGEVRARLTGLFAVRGSIALAGEVKRFRGRATDTPFGEGAARMHRATGEGVLLLRAGDRRLEALALGGEAAYFREEVVCGLEAGIAFENGRVPSSAGELNLVHVRGRGAVLLATRGAPVAIDVAPGAPLRLPLAALVGWTGALTPRLGPLADEADGAPLAVELTGEGRALADPDAAAEGGGAP